MKLNFVKNPDHTLYTKTLNFQMSNFNVFFQMVLLYYGSTLQRLVCFERMEKALNISWKQFTIPHLQLQFLFSQPLAKMIRKIYYFTKHNKAHILLKV